MPRDSNGAYSLPAGTLVSAGQTIQVNQHNPAMSDIATGLSQSLSRNGQGAMQADLNMGGYNISNVGSGGSIMTTDGVQVVSGGKTFTAPTNVCTPNNGTTGALRVLDNASTGVAYIQFVSADQTAQRGYISVLSTGQMAYSGPFNAVGALTQNGSQVWHAGNFNPGGYMPRTGGNFTGSITVLGNTVWHGGNFTPSDYMPRNGGNFVGTPPTVDGRQIPQDAMGRPGWAIRDGTGAPSGGVDGDFYFQYSP